MDEATRIDFEEAVDIALEAGATLAELEESLRYCAKEE
jgi:hypothetical protein